MKLLDDAIVFATHAHSGQVRKFSNIPYILHPFEVASIIATMTSDENTIAAGILHDTIEDCAVTPEEIRNTFGSRVFALVQSETEDRYADLPPEETWFERKNDSLLALRHTKDINVKIMWLADKLSNLRSFYREYLMIGNKIWERLNQKDPKKQEWYYREIKDCLYDLKDTAAYKEFSEIVDTLFKEE